VNTTTHPVLINAEGKVVQFEPTSVAQGIASMNVFSDLLMYFVIESNNRINNDEANPAFAFVSERDGGLVISFTTMREIFLLRDMFWEAIEKADLLGRPGIDFDGLEIIGYPSAMGPGLVTWGPAASVRRMQPETQMH
jgi:hypothetical protein